MYSIFQGSGYGPPDVIGTRSYTGAGPTTCEPWWGSGNNATDPWASLSRDETEPGNTWRGRKSWTNSRSKYPGGLQSMAARPTYTNNEAYTEIGLEEVGTIYGGSPNIPICIWTRVACVSMASSSTTCFPSGSCGGWSPWRTTIKTATFGGSWWWRGVWGFKCWR